MSNINTKIENKYVKYIKEEKEKDKYYSEEQDESYLDNEELGDKERYDFSEKYFNICKRMEEGQDVPLEDVNFVLEEIIRAAEKNEIEAK